MRELEPAGPGAPVLYDDGQPAMLFGTNSAANERAADALVAAGVRLVARLPVDQALDRLEGQPSLGLAWLELDDGDAAILPPVIDRLQAMAASRGTAVIAAAPPTMIDLLAAGLTHSRTEILIDPDEAQRVAAIATALSGAGAADGVGDVGKDNAARLRQLSDEMGRIAETLARLSTGPGAVEAAIRPAPPSADIPAPDADVVRSVIRARRLRSRFFADDLFADPAWDMLLDLLQAEIAQLRVPVSSLCIAAAVPATTALRWIKTMTEQGLFLRRADPHDGRRVFVELAPAASQAMRRYFAEVGRAAVV